MARKYRKKPVVVEAVQFLDTAERVCEISEFMDGVTVDYGNPGKPVVKIKTLEGVMRADVGDWIIKGISGEFYPCKPDVFEQTYIEEPEAELDSQTK